MSHLPHAHAFVALALLAGPALAEDRWATIPHWGPMPEPASSGMAEVNGISMYYATFGQGDPVLLIHGGMVHAGIWSAQVADLMKDHLVIVADSRGHGRSSRDERPFSYDLMADDYIALLDFLDLQKVDIVGGSDGAIIGLDIAMRHPERLDDLFAQGANVTPDGISFDAPPSEAAEAFFGWMAEDYARMSPTPDEYDAFSAQMFAMYEREPNWSDEQLATITAPVTVALGEYDELISRSHAEHMAEVIPGAKLLILPAMSHPALLQAPDEFNAAVRAAIDDGLAASIGAVAMAQDSVPSAPAGQWRTWGLASGDEFRLPAPPDASATATEGAELHALVELRTPEVLDRVAWWDATGPSYRWSQIALAEMLASGLNANVASRHLALLHTALADAMIATWDSKEAHDRPRPATSDPTLATAAPTPPSSSYPDEHAVAGAVASTVLAEIFPERAAEFVRLAEEEAQTRLLAGLAYPSDVAAGTELGRQVAAAALEHAQGDGFDKPWTGSVPSEPGLWNGTNPVMPQVSTWRPWLLASPDEFRPAPPPAYDSPERAAEMAELRAFERTPRSNAAVHFWEAAVGGLRNYEYWNLQAGRLLLESGQASDAPRAARVYALLNTAHYDAGVACWDAKYAYWTIRPVQLDPSFVTVVQTPNHPSYPAAHACYSLTAALVLAHLFPRDSEALTALGRESGTTRIWAGIHYPSDVAAGQRLAEQVAARAIERAQSDGAGF